MKKILFPTDFSKAANNAFAYTALLAESIDAIIDVVHVYNIPISTAASLPYDGMVAMLEERSISLEIKMEELAKQFATTRLGNQKLIYGVFVAAEIAEYAQQNDYDFIVMGMKGEHRRAEKRLGTVTTDLMMKATCPVLAVPENALFEGIDKIIFATDLRPNDEMPTEQALEFAEAIGAELELVYVDTLVKKRKKVLAGGSDADKTGLEFTKIISPTVMEGLDKYIRENQVDMLSLYIPRRRLWERLFHHRTSKELAFHSEIPLLVFHE